MFGGYPCFRIGTLISLEEGMKYWVYIEGKVPGAYSADELWRISGFSSTTLVCSAEGEIQDKNWRYAGEFSEIAQAGKKQTFRPPAPPSAENGLLGVENPAEALESAEAKIFLHVKELMSEIEGARREKNLRVSLQDRVEGMNRDLKQGLEEKSSLEKKVAAMEKDLSRLNKEGRESSERLNILLKEREEAVALLKADFEKEHSQSERLKGQIKELSEDLAIRNGLVNRLAEDLADKEKNLMQSLGIIKRLEEELRGISPNRTVGEDASSIKASEAEPADERPLPSVGNSASPQISSGSAVSSGESNGGKKGGFFFKNRHQAPSNSASISLLQLKKSIRD